MPRRKPDRFEKLPETVLAGVVIAAVVELVGIPALVSLYRVFTHRLGQAYGVAARPDFLAAIARRTRRPAFLLRRTRHVPSRVPTNSRRNTATPTGRWSPTTTAFANSAVRSRPWPMTSPHSSRGLDSGSGARALPDHQVQDLTSNLPRAEQPVLLDRLEKPWTEPQSVAFLPCTNMLSVGIDVKRLARPGDPGTT